MAKKLYEESNISAIASAIRSKNGLSSTYTTSDMASAILSIKTDPMLESLTVSENGSYSPGTGVDGFSKVVVSVSGSAPVLASKTISQNGTYIALDDSCDGYDQVVVSVAGGSAILDLSRSYFNGYLLPVLPEISGYSNAWIRYNPSFARFDLAIASESWFATNSDGTPSVLLDNWLLAISNMSRVKGYICSDGLSWVELSDVSTYTNFGTGASRDVIWANHNIFTDNSFDTVLYASGEAISHYTPTSTFNVETLIVSANGSYSPGTGVDGFSNVVVSVPSGGSGGSDNNFKITIGAMSGSIYDSEATAILTSAFYQNNAVCGIEMTALQSLRSWMFYSATRLSVASFPECLSIGSSCFYYCTSLKSIYAPKVTSIYDNAFNACSTLQDVIMSSLVNISSGAFTGCKSLRNVTFENCLLISTRAFAYCSNLLTVNLPKCSVVGAEAFGQCSKLSQISLPECEILSTSAFINCSALNSIYLPVCKTINNEAFYTNYGDGAKFATLDLPACTTIGNSAMYANPVLSNLSVPELKYIGYNAFGSCTSLAVVSLPKCSTIGSYAFSGCIRLESLYILSESVAVLGGSVFKSTPMVASSYLGHFGSIFVPASLVDSYKVATNWSSIADRITAYIE